MSVDDNQADLFDDNAKGDEGGSQETQEAPTVKEGEAESEESGEENTSETPSGEESKGEGEEKSTTEKMIPESRFKAALADVTAKLDAATNELAKHTRLPVPDKATDPEGYDLHVRMEASKTIMRDLVPDYEEVIKHYKEMADLNPLLNHAVAASHVPAKYAYDIAKKDLELRDLSEMKKSDEYKEFLEYRKSKKTQPSEQVEDKVGKQVTDSLSKVPNLNKATNVSKANVRSEDTDELFKGSL